MTPGAEQPFFPAKRSTQPQEGATRHRCRCPKLSFCRDMLRNGVHDMAYAGIHAQTQELIKSADSSCPGFERQLL